MGGSRPHSSHRMIAVLLCLLATTTTVWPQSYSRLGVAVRAGGLIGQTELTDKPHGQISLALRGALAGPILWDLGGGYARLDGTNFSTHLAGGELRLLVAKQTGRVRPLLYAGAGAARYNLSESPPGRTPDIKGLGTTATVPVGLGLQFVRSDSRAIEVLAGYTYTLQDDINGAIYKKGNDVLWGVTVGLTFGAFTPRDPSPSPAPPATPAVQATPAQPAPVVPEPIPVAPAPVVEAVAVVEPEPEPEPEPVPIEPAPAPLVEDTSAEVPAPELSFSPLYFTRGSTRISVNGLSLIAEIARTVQDRGVVLMEARAFTDANGRQSHLARRRAEAVEQALLAEGIEEWRVKVLVQPDVQRPSQDAWQTRRVEIVPVQ